MAFMSTHIHKKKITHPCPNFNTGFIKLPFMLLYVFGIDAKLSTSIVYFYEKQSKID